MIKSIICNEPTCDLFDSGICEECKECKERLYRPENKGKELAEGTKYDTGKARLGEMITDFAKPLFLVCKVWEFGANKYSKSNWKKVGNGKDRYTNAMLRHIASEETEIFDTETGLHHALHVAWNALARLYFIITEDVSDEKERENSGSIRTGRENI